MPLIKVDKFLGYNSTSPYLARKAEVAQSIKNLIINKGNLCNVPYPIKKVNILTNIPDYVLVGAYSSLDDEGFNVLVVFIGTSKADNGLYSQIPLALKEIDFRLPSTIVSFSGTVNLNLRSLEGGLTQTYYHPAMGNFLQIGKWLYHLALLARPGGAILNRPRMLKLKPKPLGYTGLFDNIDFVGLTAPDKVQASTFSAGNLTGNFDFAFSFKQGTDPAILNDIRIPVTTPVLRGTDEQLESNVVPDGNVQIVAAKKLTYNILLPYGQTIVDPHTTLVGIYLRLDIQSTYYWVKDVAIDSSYLTASPILEANSGKYYYTITLNAASDIVQDLTKPAELSRHSIPNPSTHAVIYKNRVYYLNSSFLDSAKYWAPGQVQYSMLVGASGTEANYIEGSFIVGDPQEALVGGIVFLGQLIIIKERSIHVLTADIFTGEVRSLFPTLGGINKLGGSAYIVINEILYFGSKDGIYAYNGTGAPVKISEDIRVDLDKIPINTYRLMRFGQDSRYGLLYVTFTQDLATDITPVFIYHYNPEEIDQDTGIGKWTTYNSELEVSNKESLVQVLMTPRIRSNSTVYQPLPLNDLNIIFVYLKNIFFMGTLEQSTDYSRRWEYTSSIFDMGDATRLKHFKTFKVEANFYLIPVYVSNDALTELIYTTAALEVKEAFTDASLATRHQILKDSQQTYLGRNLKKMQFKLTNALDLSPKGIIPAYYNRPVRIFGYQVEVEPRGRR